VDGRIVIRLELAGNLLSRLKTELPAEEYDKALEKGREYSLDRTVVELLAVEE
jgi:hypothetical protein